MLRAPLGTAPAKRQRHCLIASTALLLLVAAVSLHCAGEPGRCLGAKSIFCSAPSGGSPQEVQAEQILQAVQALQAAQAEQKTQTAEALQALQAAQEEQGAQVAQALQAAQTAQAGHAAGVADAGPSLHSSADGSEQLQATGEGAPQDLPLDQQLQGRQSEGLQSTFERFYKDSVWGKEGNGSGTGSSMNATEGIRKILFQAVMDLNVSSMIDVPCGGMLWMPTLLAEVERRRPKFRYLGLDIVRPVVDGHKQAFKAHANWKFAAYDLTTQALPRGYDLIHTRDALQHLSCRNVVAALHHLAHSGARYLLVGSYDADVNNFTNAWDGGYFDINLRAWPFSLSMPLAVLSEGKPPLPTEPKKLMLLYSVPELRRVDFGAMLLRCAFPEKCTECAR